MYRPRSACAVHTLIRPDTFRLSGIERYIEMITMTYNPQEAKSVLPGVSRCGLLRPIWSIHYVEFRMLVFSRDGSYINASLKKLLSSFCKSYLNSLDIYQKANLYLSRGVRVHVMVGTTVTEWNLASRVRSPVAMQSS